MSRLQKRGIAVARRASPPPPPPERSRLATLFDDFCVGPCSVFWGKLRGGTPPSDLADPLLEEPVAAEPEYEI